MSEYVEGAEGRFMRALKSILGTSLMNETTLVGRERKSFQDLIGRFLRHMRERLESAGVQADKVVLGRPVHFIDDDPAADATAEAQLAAAARAEGFAHVEFQYEPVAAALYRESMLDAEELALIVDIGGGTSDFSVVRLSPERARAHDRSSDILASTGVHVGGTDFDRLLSIRHVMPHFGLGSLYADGKRSLPVWYFNDMATWHRINLLYTPKVLRDIRDLAANRPWVVLFVLALVLMVTITLRTTTSAYYFKYVVERPELMASFVPTYMIFAAIGAACTPLMTRYVDKKLLMIVLMSATAVFSAAFFLIPEDRIDLMFALQAATGFVLGPKSPLAFSMYADTADYNEWTTGRRATAMTFAAATFSQKLGTAVAVSVIGAVFTALGYVPNAAQTAGSQAGIVWLMSFVPASFALLAVLVMCFYNLDSKLLARIQADLAARKAAP